MSLLLFQERQTRVMLLPLFGWSSFINITSSIASNTFTHAVTCLGETQASRTVHVTELGGLQLVLVTITYFNSATTKTEVFVNETFTIVLINLPLQG